MDLVVEQSDHKRALQTAAVAVVIAKMINEGLARPSG
jgi:hypothetical protein